MPRYIKLWLLVVCLLGTPGKGFGYVENRTDSLERIVFTDSATIPLQSAGITDTEKDTVKRRPFMDRLETFAQKKNVFSRFVRVFVVINKGAPPKDTTRAEDKKFDVVQGRIVRHMDIIVLDPFGYNVHQTFVFRPTWVNRALNNIHYNSRNWVIKNKLLFREGDTLDAFKISESERLLRSSGYIRDARIQVKPVAGSQDSADVFVIAQDQFSLGVEISTDRLRNGFAAVEERNFIGMGHGLYYKANYDPNQITPWWHSFRYVINEISKSYISAEAHVQTLNDYQRFGVSANRPFITPSFHWAGGLAVDYVWEKFNVLGNNNVSYTGFHSTVNTDIWGGYAFRLPGIGPDVRKSRLILSGRIFNRTFTDLDLGQLETELPRFESNTLYLLSLGYNFREYFKDHFIFGFGRAEDVPLGYIFSLTGGLDDGETYHRFYGGFRAAYGWNNSSMGYLYLGVQAGAFLATHDKLEQGVISAQALYFTNMLPVGKWRVRQFLWNRLVLGYNRNRGEMLNISNLDGLRVFKSDFLRGTQKLIANYEIDFYTPYEPIGFGIVGVIMADFAMIGDDEHPLLQSRIWQGYGIGIRFKNERLIFNTVQVSIHYFPDASSIGAQEFSVNLTERSYYRFPDFQFSPPALAPF